MKLGPLVGKDEVTSLLRAAQKALRVSTDVRLAQKLDTPMSTLNSWKRRGRIPAEHRLALMEVIRTGKAPTPDISLKQRDLCKESFDDAWLALGPRGRAQLSAEFTVWIQERKRDLRRLDIGVAKRETG